MRVPMLVGAPALGQNQPRDRHPPDARAEAKASLDPRASVPLLFATSEIVGTGRPIDGDRPARRGRRALVPGGPDARGVRSAGVRAGALNAPACS